MYPGPHSRPATGEILLQASFWERERYGEKGLHRCWYSVSLLWLLCLSQPPIAFSCPIKDVPKSKCHAVSEAHTPFSLIPRGFSFLRFWLFHCLIQRFTSSLSVTAQKGLMVLLKSTLHFETRSHNDRHSCLSMFQTQRKLKSTLVRAHLPLEQPLHWSRGLGVWGLHMSAPPWGWYIILYL